MGIEVIEPQVEEIVQEAEEVHEEVEQEEEVEQAEDEGDVVVTIGDEQPEEEQEVPQAAPQWVKDLRKSQRELQKENRELKAQLTQAKPKEEVPAVGAKPTLEGCDYDADEFEKQYDAWLGRKQKAEAAERDSQRQQEEAQKSWQLKLDNYGAAKEKLRVKDFEDAEEAVLGALAETQQGVIVAYAENPALVVYALGKNPGEMAKLAAMKDPIEFALAMKELEKKMKVQARKPATKPEGSVSGTAPKSGSVDNQLERLRADAERTGDYSKVTAYKKQLRDKQRA